MQYILRADLLIQYIEKGIGYTAWLVWSQLVVHTFIDIGKNWKKMAKTRGSHAVLSRSRCIEYSLKTRLSLMDPVLRVVGELGVRSPDLQ